MAPETRPRQRHDTKPPRYSPFGALVLVLILALADTPRLADTEERTDGQA